MSPPAASVNDRGGGAAGTPGGGAVEDDGTATGVPDVLVHAPRTAQAASTAVSRPRRSFSGAA
ncbi:hypothetical protein [Umezawaea sp. NPDC059074]|uniref:hypothetical protein n=1 Tax=Umezawaea sp. NPDC059074 TaxID=3346716 RepID=UPI003686A071